MKDKTEVLEVEVLKKKKLKPIFKLIFSLIGLVLVFGLILIIYYNYSLSPISNSSKIIKYRVENGSSVYKVGRDLESKGIIRSSFAYKIYVKLHNINGYKKGTYTLDKSYSTRRIVSILNGDSYKENGVKITFKEGITIKKIAKEIAKHTNITESEVYSKLEDKKYIDSLINQYWFLTDDIKDKNIYYPLEGYLYPETYMFDEDVKIEDIFKEMLDQTSTHFMKYKSNLENSKYTINQIVALASVIEQEGIYEKDRKGIASVFYNRLNKNMPLGSDVTTYYAFKVDMGSRELTSKEFNTYNPYNTRGPKMNGKIPVGAISNFSDSSLDAALNPLTTDYYYFVADKSGKTHFTKTYEEHKKVIKELKAANNWIGQ